MPEDVAHLLVVDDDNRLRELLRRYLAEQGFRVTTAENAAAARARLASMEFDLIVLDRMMPGESGLDFAAALRRESEVPILMLTAMGEPEDRILGLESGADDYLPKPFEPRELLARIRTVLRRAPLPRAEPPLREIRFGDCVFEIERQLLTRSGVPIRLTSTEAALLRALALAAGRPVSRESLSEAPGQSRTVDVQVTRLRRKIEADPKFPRYLQTVRGKGYVLLTD
ncbi:MAG TPA: response regulator transcription factor [Alphaproteobacteria bacterium]|jgi:two-component system phosphate regulon response regulator OmpR|nr:response regulator transcription factor [Alphaproteobacteria bacterium]